MAENKNDGIGSSIFWISWIAISLIAMIYLGVWSKFAESITGLALAFIFSLMVVAGILISTVASEVIPKFKIFRLGSSWVGECMSFSVLFAVFYFLARLGLMLKKGAGIGLFSMSGNKLFATVKSSLPLNAEIIMDTTIIPFAEEMIWALAIPILLIAIMYKLSKVKRLDFLNNDILQIAVISVVSASTFAFFHVGSVTILAFIISASLFRTVQAVLYWGDRKKDLLPGVTLYMSGILGAHIGNNMAQYGLGTVLSAMIQNFAGILLLLYFLIIFGTAIYGIFRKKGKKKSITSP